MPFIRLAGRAGKRGSSILEFALAGTFIFLPLLAGTATVGMSMARSMEATSLNRDVGHMFATGVDFSRPANVNLLARIGASLQITNSAGKGVIILSEIDGTGNNQAVCSRRIVIGNAALRSSSYVNPSANVLDAGGNVTNLNDASAQANAAFTALMPLSQGEVVYLAETYVSTADYDWAGFLTGTGIYTKAIF